MKWRRLNLTNNIPEKCQDCTHRKNAYCRAYQADIELINSENCKRKKTFKKRVKKT